MARLIFLAAFALAGCSGLRPEAFRQFSSSVKDAQAGLELLMDKDVEWAREADVYALAADPGAKLSRRMIVSEGKGWRIAEPPGYWDARRTRRSLLELNAAFRQYAALLAEGAGGALAGPERFDDAAENWNAGFRAWTAGRPDPEKTAAQGASLITESFHRFAGRRRAEDLRWGISQNQPWVEAHARLGASLAGLIRADLTAAYNGQLKAIHAGWDDKRAPGRVTLTRSLFNLNDGFVDAMEALDRIEDYFAALPAAHRALGDSAGKTGAVRAVADLAESAERVDRFARRLEKTK